MHSVCKLIGEGNWSTCSDTKKKLKGEECFLACKQIETGLCWSSQAVEGKDFPAEFKKMMIEYLKDEEGSIGSIKLPPGDRDYDTSQRFWVLRVYPFRFQHVE